MCWQVHILHLNTVFIFTNLVTITTIIILLSLYCDHFYYKICVSSVGKCVYLVPGCLLKLHEP